MNKLNRALLSGASFAVLALGLPNAANAAAQICHGPGDTGCLITVNQTRSVFGGTAGGGVIHGSMINDGLIEYGKFTGVGQYYSGMGLYAGVSLTGNMVNNGTILVEGGGFNGSEVIGGIINGPGVNIGGEIINNGVIDVSVGITSGFHGTVAGILIIGDNDPNTTIVLNDPDININITGNGSLGVNEQGFFICGGEGTAGIDCVPSYLLGGEGNGGEPVNLKTLDPNVYGIADFYNGSHVFNMTNDGGLGISILDIALAAGTWNVFGVDVARTSGVGNVSLNFKNNGAIDINEDLVSFEGVANAQGVHLSAWAAGATNASANFTNAGTISVHARAASCSLGGGCWGIGEEFADAVGVDEFAGDATNASLGVNNTGKIIAVASVESFGDGAWFGAVDEAFATGVFQEIEDAEFAVNKVTNAAGATIGAGAFAIGGTNMDAFAGGVIQEASEVDLATNAVVNAGLITVAAIASEVADFSPSGTANASAIGAAQSMFDVGGMKNTFSNEAGGVVHVSAIANAHDFWNANATANAVGVLQSGSWAFSVNNVLVNAGTIAVGAHALAEGVTTIAGFIPVTNAIANAHAIGVEQFASNSFWASAKFAQNVLTNSGKILVAAQASAFASVFAEANATETAVIQDAFAVSSAFATGNAGNKLVNSGTIVGEALALASAASASAHALDPLILQTAIAAGFAHNTLTNNGVLFAFAQATAVGLIADATATATAIEQFADAGFTAVNFISNAGTIQAVANANAFGFTTASANAWAEGASQEAIAGGLAANSMINSGKILVGANAFAEAVVSATATAGALGVEQWADAGSTASNAMLNATGAIIAASAHATAIAVTTGLGLGGTFAEAEASAFGVVQEAFADDFASNSLINEGIIDAFASANAIAQFTAEAFAEATGVGQEAEGETAALNSVVNAAGATIAAQARAFASALSSASATAFAAGVEQDASGDFLLGSLANNVVVNDGLIDVHATAKAVALGTAFASASAYGIEQFAEGASGEFNTVVNATGALINVVASANASADGLGGVAVAEAFAHGIEQTATEALGAFNKVSNAGTINVSAKAFAFGSTAAAAEAEATGIAQSATAGSVAGNDVLNSGLIRVRADATEVAWLGLSAEAFAIGITQFADAFTAASNVVTNLGTIDVGALANASDFGIAEAEAEALGIGQEADAFGFAFNAVSNATGALLTVNATANAGAVITALASALAHGIDQFADASLEANNFVINEGDIQVHAHAFASASGLAEAGAEAAGIEQTAWAFGFTSAGVPFGASNTVINGGEINVGAKATAIAGFEAFAEAEAQGVSQSAWGFGGVLAHNFVSNSGAINVNANATALALSGAATAFAFAGGVAQDADSAIFVANTVINSGTIGPFAHAFAEGFFTAFADASAVGVDQFADFGVFVSNDVVNTGKILATALATAKAGISAAADAFAEGIEQVAWAGDVVANSVVNSGTVNASAHAHATAGLAGAEAEAIGVDQDASATTFATGAFNFVSNNGLINVTATAHAKGGAVSAHAFAGGVGQFAFGASELFLENTLFNDGTINAHAAAVASGHGGLAVAGAGASGVFQEAVGNSFAFTTSGIVPASPALVADNFLSNNGVIDVAANAKATGGVFASATASAHGVVQIAGNAFFAFDTLINNGTINVVANATALATADGLGVVFAGAHAVGVSQQAGGLVVATGNVQNNGLINVSANANAQAENVFALGAALASAHATGVNIGVGAVTGPGTALTTGGVHHVSGAHATLINEGTINVHAAAVANATGTTFFGATGASLAVASANAQGVNVFGAGPFLGLDIVNDGSIIVGAKASGDGLNIANAGGIFVFGSGDVWGTIANHGKISVVASATGAGIARATGIGVVAHTFAPPTSGVTALIENTGSLVVKAIVGAGGVANATAIRVSATPAGGPAGTGVGTIVNNSGIIYAGISVNGGATFQRGTAINVANAPNAMDILLEGSAHAQAGYPGDSGLIYGNIFLSTDDSVIVENGKTCFNGVINSATLLSHGNLYASNAGVVVNPAVSAIAVGHLTIAGNGTLVLVNDTQQGAAAAYVGTFSEQAGGDLVLEARGIADGPGASNLGGDNTLGKIVAKTNAFIAGHLEIVPYAGLYTNTTYHVVSAGHITGQFADVNTHSIFLSGTVSNNANLTIDTLSLTRNAFNSIAGLTHNEHAVATGIENSYAALIANPTANPNYARFVGTLFLIGSPSEYAADLYQLSGTEYGQQAKATLLSSRILNDTIGTHLQLVAAGGSDSVGQLIPGVSPARGGTGIGKGNIWVSAYGDWSTVDANSSGPSAKIDDKGIFGGVDFDVDAWTKVGVTAGHTSGSTGFSNDMNNGGNYTGWHVGLYGRYDFDPWYVQAIGSYGMFTNSMQRNIDINPSLSPICCSFPFSTPGAIAAANVTAGTVRANQYDSHTYAAQGEVGYHWDTGSAVDLTPFLSLSYLHADSDAFHETGLLGAELSVADASSTSFNSQLGLRFSTDWQITDSWSMTPVIRAAWEHEWDGTAWAVNEGFFDATVPTVTNSQFRINGTGYSRDFADLGAGLGFGISKRVEAVIGYEGRWSSDEKDNAILGHVNVTW